MVAQAHPLRSRALAELLARAIDYAGLYPPAALPMVDAVREYAAQRSGPHAWALGRFVVGADQLDAFIAARRPHAPGAWPLSVLVPRSDGWVPGLAAHADILRVEAIEAKAATSGQVHALEQLKSVAPELYVEIPPGSEFAGVLTAVHALGARAKIRTGGVTPDTIPGAETIARFMQACINADVPFKATAGLHHLLRGEYPLTYAPGSARATMFGFLNVFIAATFAARGVSIDVLTQVLEERDVRAFTPDVSDAGAWLCWRDHCLTRDDVRRARERGIASFGSCSFAEPIAELASAGLLAAP